MLYPYLIIFILISYSSIILLASRTHKRKFGPVTFFPKDLTEGKLDPIANKKVSYLACHIYYSTESITSEVTTERDKLGLSEC